MDAQQRLQPHTQNTRGRGSSTQSIEADSTPSLLLHSTQSRITYGQRGTNKVLLKACCGWLTPGLSVPFPPFLWSLWPPGLNDHEKTNNSMVSFFCFLPRGQQGRGRRTEEDSYKVRRRDVLIHKPQNGQQSGLDSQSLHEGKWLETGWEFRASWCQYLPPAGACFIYVSEDIYVSSLSRRSRLKAFRIKVAVVRQGPRASSDTCGEEVSPTMRLRLWGDASRWSLRQTKSEWKVLIPYYKARMHYKLIFLIIQKLPEGQGTIWSCESHLCFHAGWYLLNTYCLCGLFSLSVSWGWGMGRGGEELVRNLGCPFTHVGCREDEIASRGADSHLQFRSSPSSHPHPRAQTRKAEITGLQGLTSGGSSMELGYV